MENFTNEIVIRPIVAGDEEKINEFFSAMGGESRAFFNRGGGNQAKTIEFAQKQNLGKQYWMAELEDKMVGLVFLWDLLTGFPWLGIAVREDLKGMHLGPRLIAFAQKYAAEQGKGGIQLTTHMANVRGQALYEKMGFRRIGTHGPSGEIYYLYRIETNWEKSPIPATPYDDGVTIRPIVPEDEALIEDFFRVMGGESRAFFNRGDGNKRWTLTFCKEQTADQQFWMAEEDGKMVGLVFLWDLHTGLPWLGIAVREDYKGKHMGTRLIAYAQKYAEEQGKGGIQLTTHVANLRGQALYEKMGFRRMGIYGSSGEIYYLFRYGQETPW